MRELNDELKQLRDVSRRFFADKVPVEHSREVLAIPSRFDEGAWDGLVRDMGLAGLGVGEDAGGMRTSLHEPLVVCEAIGAHLVLIPFAETFLMSSTLLARLPQSEVRTDLLSRLTAGDVVLTAPDSQTEVVVSGDGAVSGTVTRMRYASAADAFILVNDDRAVMVEARQDGVRIEPASRLDAAPLIEQVVFSGAVSRLIADRGMSEARDRAFAEYLLGMGAECTGVASELLRLTTDYLKVREQFGRTLGSMQALKHRLANAQVEIEGLAAGIALLAEAIPQEEQDRLPIAFVSFAQAVERAILVAEDCVQLLGGIGFTWEHDAHLYLRRLLHIRSALGPPSVGYGALADRAHLQEAT